MNDFLNTIWLDNPVRLYCIVGGIILFVILFRRYISRYVSWGLASLLGLIWKRLDKKAFTSLVVHPIGLYLSAVVAITATNRLKFPSVLNVELYKISAYEFFQWLATVVLIISFIHLLLHIVDFIAIVLRNRTADKDNITSNKQFISFFKSLTKALIVVMGILMLFKYAFSYDISGLITGLGFISAAVAFSLRESLENLIASFVIFVDKPFTTGDTVKVQQITGTIEEIGLRSTRVRTEQKTYVSVPNKQMVDSIVDNLSLRTQRRGDIRLELGLDTPPAKIEQVIASIKEIINRTDIQNGNVFLTAVTGNAIIVQSDFYTAPITAHRFNIVREEVNLAILKLLETLEIEIAGAATDVRVTNSTAN